MSLDLRPFLAPKRVAVVGAGERTTSSGGAVMQMLRKGGFSGELIPVNPKGGEIFGLPARTSLAEIEGPLDLAVVVIRPDLIPETVREAGLAGHKNILVLPGGFAEAGPEGLARDAELREIAAEHGVTIAGPNCAGIVHLREGSRFAATFLRDLPPGGGLAFVSQSGAIAEEVIAKANEIELKFGTIISLGNAMRIGVEDYLEFLGADETVSAIVLYIESLEDPHRFREVARRIAAKKPVIAFMGGRTAAGAAAAAAHTGAVANDDSTIETFCRDSGVLRVRSLREMLLASKGFGTFPMGLGKRALVLSNSGGPGVICTDAAALAGLELPDLPNSMATIMRAELPGEAAVANPIDLLADAREERFAMTLDLALEHARDTYDAILMIHVVPFMVDPVPVIAAMAERARATDMPILHAMMGTLPDKDSWFATMETAGVPMFNNVEEMAACAGMLAAYPALRVSAEEAMRRNDDAPVTLKGRS